MNSRNLLIILLHVSIILLFLIPIFTYSQGEDFKTRIAIIPMINVEKDERFNTIVDAVTDTIELTLKLTGKYNILYLKGINPYENMEYIKQYAENNKIDNILFGKAYKGKDDRIVFEINVYDREKKDIIITKREKPESILEIFNATDTLVKRVIEVFSGIHVGFGSIELINEGEEGEYEVFLNGENIGKNLNQMDKVLNGEYILEIKQKRMFGEQLIFHDKIAVYEDKKSVVKFKIPYLTDKEKKEIGRLTREIENFMWDNEKINIVENDLSKLLTLFKDLQFCPSLINKKKEILKLNLKYKIVIVRWTIENLFLDSYSNLNKEKSLVKEIITLKKEISKENTYKDLINEIAYNSIFYSTVLRIKAINSFAKKDWVTGIKRYDLIKILLEDYNDKIYKINEEIKYIESCNSLYKNNPRLLSKKIKSYFKDEINKQIKFYKILKTIKGNDIVILTNPLFINLNVNGENHITPFIINDFNKKILDISINDPWFIPKKDLIRLYKNQKIVFIIPEFKGYYLIKGENNILSKIPSAYSGEIISNSKLKIKWNNIQHANYYKLQIFTLKENQIDLIYSKSRIKKNSFILKLPLDSENKYYYRICAVNKNGLNSRWSNFTPLLPDNINKK